jgi:hypothetical protein
VDFNSRVKRADAGEYYHVALSEIGELDIGSRALASDFEDIDLPVEITALLHREGTAIVKVIRMTELQAVTVNMQGPAQLNPTELKPDSLELGLLPA